MSSTTQTSSAAIEGRLWSVRADDWAAIQERQVAPAYEAALDALRVGPSTRLLDAGCGAGMFMRLAADRGADVHGLDASEGLLAHARGRVPGAPLLQGELEQLPYEDASFDIVTGFNSFQYAARPAVALAEAGASPGPSGRVLLLNWAPAELCEAAGYLMALGRLMPPPPPGTPGPFALSDSGSAQRAVRRRRTRRPGRRGRRMRVALPGRADRGRRVDVLRSRRRGDRARRRTGSACSDPSRSSSRFAPPPAATASRTSFAMSSALPAAELARDAVRGR